MDPSPDLNSVLTCPSSITTEEANEWLKIASVSYTHLDVYKRQESSDAALCAAFARVETARQEAGNIALTYFEFGTLAAWEVFAAAGVEAAILEVGLGGRLDAVNAYEPDVSIVTTVALDHTEWLGTDRARCV